MKTRTTKTTDPTAIDGERRGPSARAVAVAILLGIAATAMIVDAIHVATVATEMRNAAHSAARAGAIDAERSTSGGTAPADRTAAALAGRTSLAVGAAALPGVRLTAAESTVTPSPDGVGATLAWKAEVATDLTRLLGLPGVAIAGTATETAPPGTASERRMATSGR
ncbi:hypothetical protein [Pinisolibacter aquiterrae]|uniref:hypothetical protein n=1 Tax=Pinisolibacter aquiterrae TaxID=2815579 RepID=UPI001C3CD095|nr:hypothetical protein [Pinisolibacter aquiterrae]MBV5265283.1 hypothetical protein [Pinisolibacter aquiterrae]MCC8235389.1 hypothetical protein [Pinisolibacter aquiterrae]